MGLQKEVWSARILGKVFPNDSFLVESVDESMWVDNKTVHSPEEGEEPEVEVNGGTFPMQVKHRDDVDNTYDLRNYRTKPIMIDDVDATEVSYNKMDSVLRQHVNVLNRNVGNWMLYDWAPSAAATILRTAGANRAASAATNVGATGTRKKIQVDQILAAMSLMDDMDLPMEGRNLLIPAQMYSDLITDNWKDLVSLQTSGEAVLSGRQLLVLFGFKVWKRGGKNVLTYTNAGTPVVRAPIASNLAAANAAALCWHKDWVKRAKGGVKVYTSEDDPTYQANVLSARVRAGGRKAANDGTGVVAIVEAA